MLARGESVPEIRQHGIQLHQKDQVTPPSMHVQVIESLEEIPPPDIVIITVKNYDLHQTAQMLRLQLGEHQPIIASLQNGVENQRILPKYFSKPTFGVICYNAWRESPSKVNC